MERLAVNRYIRVGVLCTIMRTLSAIPVPSLTPDKLERIPEFPSESRRIGTLRNKTSEEEAKNIWKNADAVCLDVDSTVCRDEILDELAGFLGMHEEMGKITVAAMNGQIDVRDSLRRRMSIMRPTQDQIKKFLHKRLPKMTNGSSELVSALKERGVEVYLVSSGFRTMIYPVADLLGIPRKNVYAHDLVFAPNGDFEAIDERLFSYPNVKPGKKAVMSTLKSKFAYRNLVMVGDGANDVEAHPPADTFIGFGGNKVREFVREHSPWYVTSFETLVNELN